ncbi:MULTISPECIES: FtsX-like permease family protein [Nocardioides]|uniref:FtsX-like permease family protein n=1 Tax=Nocardioides vastitatis TaxID=2568655 RepID=A0ABW0ZGQ5_9ACTN|nr:FtsX-like permease family protein [Nocardioides sp.]THJ02723.1 FtsX-like permease family protein [Nocardioides sp.]
MSASTRGGWRVALRLARREALRRKGQTVLMLVLICLPVVAVTAAAIVWRTQDVSSAESVDRRMGSADALVETTGADRVVQGFDPYDSFGTFGEDDLSPGPNLGRGDVEAVLDVLGHDRPVIPLDRDSRLFETDRGVGDMEVVTTDLAHPLADGLLERVEGKYPPGPGEVVVNQALASRGPGIGDTLTVIRKTADGEKTLDLEVVGIAESTENRGYELAAGLPGAFGETENPTGRWLVGGGPVSWDDVRALNAIGVLVASRQVLTDPPPESALDPVAGGFDEPVDQVVVSVLALVGVMVLLEVVLLAGPAFAVRAKAQAHTLALVAAAGGTPGQARRTVLASGVVIGGLGGVLGVGIGIGIGAVAVPVAQLFDTTRFGPFDVPWPLLLLVAGFGFLSAVLAAVVPAFSASRQDVVAVLAGRRGERRLSVRSPFLGLALLGAGVAGAAVGAGTSGRGGGAGSVLIAGSALVSVVGMILVVPVVIALVARSAARLPLALRFAARDASRHRTRTVPAVAAVGATVAGVVALGIAVSSQEAANADAYVPMLPDGYGSVALSADADRSAVVDVLGRSLRDDQVVDVRGVQTSTDQGELEFEFRQGGDVLMLSHWGTLGSSYVVGAKVPDYVDLSADARAEADAVLDAGGLVLMRSERSYPEGYPAPELDGGPVTVDVRRWSPEEEASTATDVASAAAPSAVVEVSRSSPAVVLFSPRLLERLGLETSTVGMFIYGPVSEEAEKDLQEALAALPTAAYLYVERGYQPDAAVRIVQVVLAALGGILMLGGTLTATFLALSDARPDLATMAAVGARPRTRRTVAAAYALVVGGVGAVLGAPVGFIPGLAISQPLTRSWETGATAVDVPWLLILTVVAGLPLLTAAAVGACARGRLPLTARID